MPSKTETVKQRRVDVYAPTLEAKARWQVAANKAGISLSKYLGRLLEEELAGKIDGPSQRQQDLEVQVIDLETENHELQEQVEDLRTLKRRLEEELETYRTQSWNQEVPIKQLDPRLIEILSTATGSDHRNMAVPDSELHKKLRIKRGEVDRLDALNKQLEVLELHGIVKHGSKGWTWHG